ncbi:MAG: ATP-sensitive inward rectifier potassium channel 10 [Alphaproteobacteria bacterium]|nr:ATP-sensitive inward rectifier potassium channel 10 [Alphaproteobacteria bacterium]
MFFTRRTYRRRKEDQASLPASPDVMNIETVAEAHRFISRDGRANIHKYGFLRRQRFDWYHHLMTIRLPWLVVLCGLAYFLVNACFATLYMLMPNGFAGHVPHHFFGYFFFSSHVFSTLGFNEFYPTASYTNALTTVESFLGWCSFGLITGLLFSRFSRPSARVIFSHYATVELYDGIPTLTFRIANKRDNLLLQAQLHVTLARSERTLEGEQIRRIYDLHLIRSSTSFFNLTWTVRHPIDEHSPLFGQTPEELKASETEITVLLSGTDDAYGQTVHGHFAYNHAEILLKHRFANMFTRDAHGHPVIDFSKFDSVEVKPTDETEEQGSD